MTSNWKITTRPTKNSEALHHKKPFAAVAARGGLTATGYWRAAESVVAFGTTRQDALDALAKDYARVYGQSLPQIEPIHE